MFRPMRRFAQQLSEEECLAILTDGKRGVLALSGDDGYPYALPINYRYEDGVLYFHGAKEGHKLDAIRREPKASFCVYAEDRLDADGWSHHLKSVICFGRIALLTDPEDILRHARKLGEKYFPEGYDIDADMARSGPRVAVFALTIDHMTGKRVHEK